MHKLSWQVIPDTYREQNWKAAIDSHVATPLIRQLHCKRKLSQVSIVKPIQVQSTELGEDARKVK